MKMTMPQLIMLNHAAWVNYKRMESRSEAKTTENKRQAERDEKDPIVFKGKRMSEMDSLDMQQYYGGMFG